MPKLLFAALASATLTAGIATAQQTAPPPSPCETDAAFHAFDFWIGDWKVSARSSGKYAGENSITPIEGQCALMEDWKGQAGSTGKSLNYYNPLTKTWRQIWVSAGAYSLDIEGGMQEGSMVLEGTIWYYASGQSAPFRGTWTPNADGSVRQFFEQYDAGKQAWQPWFDGLYERR